MRKVSIHLILWSMVFWTLSSCQKEPGPGGLCSIKGKITKDWRVVISNPGTSTGIAPAPDEEVYIIYGDHLSPDDKVMTNYKGEFEFLSLREGAYTVYVYSKDTLGAAADNPDKMEVKAEVVLSGKRDSKDLGTIMIYDIP